MLKIYFDGGCRPNPGMMESGAVARGVFNHRREIGQGSSELAEWLALLHALDVARSLSGRDILLLGDSIGVINQATGKAPCRLPDVYDRFEQGVKDFDRVRIRHIKRSQNLAGIALGLYRQRPMMPRPPTKEQPR